MGDDRVSVRTELPLVEVSIGEVQDRRVRPEVLDQLDDPKRHVSKVHDRRDMRNHIRDTSVRLEVINVSGHNSSQEAFAETKRRSNV